MGSQGFTHDKSYYPVPRTSMEFAKFYVAFAVESDQPWDSNSYEGIAGEISPREATDSAGLLKVWKPTVHGYAAVFFTARIIENFF